jgi:hypothetical protein
MTEIYVLATSGVDQLEIHEARVRAGEGSAKADARIRFERNRREPYELTGKLEATDIPAQHFTAVREDAQPALEGSFGMSSEVESRAPNLPTLLETLGAHFQLTGGPGTLRVFETNEATRQVRQLLQAGSLISALGGDSVPEGVRAGLDLALALESIDFDELRFDLRRERGGALEIEDYLVRGNQIFLGGSGRVDPTRRLSRLPFQPQAIGLRIGLKGSLADKAVALPDFLSGKTTDDGYRLWATDFTISGTPAAPDTSQVRTFLVERLRAALGGTRGNLLPGRGERNRESGRRSSPMDTLRSLIDSARSDANAEPKGRNQEPSR